MKRVSQEITKLRPKVATASLKLCSRHLISPGLCFSARLTFSGSSTPAVTWLEEAPLPKQHYSLAIPSIVKRLPLPIDHQVLTKALLRIGRHPVLLARLLDTPTPAMLENYFDQYSALKLHQAWHARKALEAAAQHLLSLNLPTRLAPILCSVQLPLTAPITHQRLVLDIQTKVLASQEDFFRTETKLLLWLTYARSHGVSLVDRQQLITTLRSTADCVNHALARLEANTSVRLIDSDVMLFNEYYLESSLHDALTHIESFAWPPQFYGYEIDDCLERVSLQRKESPNSSISEIIRQCLNNRISTVYTSPVTMLHNLLPLLSLTSQQLFDSRPIIVAPVASSIEQFATPYGAVVALAHLESSRFSLGDTVIIALDADTYSKHEFLTLLRGMTIHHRLLIHATSYSELPDFVSKTQYLISHAYPFITLHTASLRSKEGLLTNNMPFTHGEHNEPGLINHFNAEGKKRSTRVYFDVDLPHLFRLLLRIKAVALVPSTRQALKLSKLLHTRRKRTTRPSIKTIGLAFFPGDRIIFLAPRGPLEFERNPIGIILSIHETTVILKINETYLPITVEVFLSSNPSPCYFLSADQLKRAAVDKSIIIVPKNGQYDHYMQLADHRSNMKIGVIYGIKNLTITLPKTIPIERQTMMNIIPRLVKPNHSVPGKT
ncbi:hypothetical protein [Pseudomonas syringae]|uniref:hypothetical protein n=1 Tax=Pseudomonas syringae TaxID=317 RepID=UPI001BD0792E|nr:hypothetical protein [Pseudomonas syringae]QVI69404.1 hypothetical protein KHW12_19980 [Pseudomonas syringae]